MPNLPSLNSAFSALGAAFKVPKTGTFATPTAMGAPALPNLSTMAGGTGGAPMSRAPVPMGMPTPARPGVSPFGAAPAQPVSPFGIGTPNMSTPAGPKYAPPPTITPAANMSAPAAPAVPNVAATTNQPAAPAGTPAVPATGSTPSPYVTTPSGATVDPNTGTLISPAPTGTNVSAESGGTVGLNTGNQGSTANYSGSAGGPALPTSYDPMITTPAAEQAFKDYESSLSATPDELAAMKRLNDLNASSAQAYTNTEGQAIPLEFITGQKAALQRSQNALAQPLEAQLSLLQAKRQMASTASKAALDRLDAQLAAKRDLAKPVSTAYGGTLSRYNPTTGKYETVVNPFGTASGGGANVTDVIGKAISEGRLTADQVTRYGIPFLADALNKDPGYNFVTQKASITSDTASLKTNQAYADSTSRAFNTANANLQQLVTFMGTAGVNTGSTVPIINELQNKVKAGVTDAGTIAAYQAALAGLRAEYAQVLSRGGEVTEGQRAQAASLIPDNLTASQLQQVTDRLKIEGNNAISEANAKVKEIQTRLGSNTGGSSSASGGSSSVPASWNW